MTNYANGRAEASACRRRPVRRLPHEGARLGRGGETIRLETLVELEFLDSSFSNLSSY